MVMISHTHKFVFLKTRKTAGTSIEMCLEPFCAPAGHEVKEETDTLITKEGVVGARMARRMNSFRHPNARFYNHMPASKVRWRLGPLKWRRYTKIASVRNPFDRMISLFHWSQRQGDPLPDSLDVHREAFREFLFNSDWSTDESIVLIGKKLIPTHWIRFENLNDDLKTLTQELGLDETKVSLPQTKVMSSKRKGYSVPDYYDDQTIAAVKEKLWWSFSAGGYPHTPTRSQEA